jgi:hypothetical protein
VKPETVVGWHRWVFRRFWMWRSRHRRLGRRPAPPLHAPRRLNGTPSTTWQRGPRSARPCSSPARDLLVQVHDGSPAYKRMSTDSPSWSPSLTPQWPWIGFWRGTAIFLGLLGALRSAVWPKVLASDWVSSASDRPCRPRWGRRAFR